jgi:Protein phosphatase 2C
MRIALATDPGTPGWPNEDFAAAAPGAAVLLDGCTTTPRGAGTGCLHGVAWYARTLGTEFLAAITADPPPPLDNALAGAIAEVRARHEKTCDLASPRTPAATVTAVRAGRDGFELLALSDSSIVADYGEGRDPLVLSDTHRAASTDPDAARQARTLVLAPDGLHGIALLSDGAARLTDVYHVVSWPALVTVLRDEGPATLIRKIRAAEDSDPDRTRWPRSKTRDDATALYWPQPGD